VQARRKEGKQNNEGKCRKMKTNEEQLGQLNRNAENVTKNVP
jgi:hypothetical protein